ncbi:MAG TPA: hypothetical protein PKE65_10665 [Rhizobiaceae bacterium]|nr:hypothetical protein [Rhizobiaceae bacterium]
MERFKLKSPTSDVHAAAKAFSEEHGRLFVDNARRLSLSVAVEDESVLKPLETLGVSVQRELRYDLETATGE